MQTYLLLEIFRALLDLAPLGPKPVNFGLILPLLSLHFLPLLRQPPLVIPQTGSTVIKLDGCCPLSGLCEGQSRLCLRKRCFLFSKCRPAAKAQQSKLKQRQMTEKS